MKVGDGKFNYFCEVCRSEIFMGRCNHAPSCPIDELRIIQKEDSE